MGISMGWPHYIEQHEAVDSLVEQIPDDIRTHRSGPDGTGPANGARRTRWLAAGPRARRQPAVGFSQPHSGLDQPGGCADQLDGGACQRPGGPGDQVEIDVREPAEAVAFKPEPMQLAIVHEDELLIVIDKPPGLVVHPGAGNWSGTLLNGLLAHRSELSVVPRAGIVHRLDAGTSA